jgi:6-phosphogluconolactonase
MVSVFKNPENLLPALADFIAIRCRESIDHHGEFTIALSGGSSPKKLYELLASGAYQGKIDWSKVYFFFGDERYVPLDHPDSNFLMAKNALFTPLGISGKQIFPINTTLTPDDSANAYEQDIVRHFKDRPCKFDFILLGLGDNSHTASLFPHTSVLHEQKALIKGLFIEEVKMFRITFTVPLINRAQVVTFLVYGAAKAEAVHHILEDPLNTDEYPAQLIHPENGELYWYLDEAAAREIDVNRKRG